MTTSTRRRDLQRVALELFLENGYESVSVAQIASTAGVSHMTFFRHFPTKDAVVVEDVFDPAIAAAVAAEPATDTALKRTVNGLMTAMASPDARQELESEEFRIRIQLAARTASLRNAVRASTDATEEALYEALASTGTKAVDARAAAGAVMGAATAILLDWATDPSTGDPVSYLSAGFQSLLGPAS